MRIYLIIGILAIGALVRAEKLRYDNYKLARLNFGNEEHIKLVDYLEENNPRFDVWNGIKAVNYSVDVMLSPADYEVYKSLFHNAKMDYSIINDDIQREIDAQEESMRANRNSAIVGRYARYSQILAYIQDVVSQNSDIASAYTAGSTYENRQLRVIVLKGPNARKKVWIDCGIHAREWVSISTCVWTIDRLVREYRQNDPVTVNMLNKYEFHILPLVNPDGYEFSHTNQRMWRKNKRPNSGSSCVGTDLNRNFDFKWMVSGSSNQPCNEAYAGPYGSSESEVQAIQKAIRDRMGTWEIFITIHSYGAFWMPPWAYQSQLPADYSELESYARIATNAVRAVNGLNFKIGPPHMTVQYSASGGSYDWAKAVCGVKYAYALELRPEMNSYESYYGFQLPESYAPGVGQETYAGLKAMIDAIGKRN